MSEDGAPYTVLASRMSLAAITDNISALANTYRDMLTRLSKLEASTPNIEIGQQFMIACQARDDARQEAARLQTQVEELTAANEYLVGEKMSLMQKITNLEVESARFKELWKTAEAEAAGYENGMRKLIGDCD